MARAPRGSIAKAFSSKLNVIMRWPESYRKTLWQWQSKLQSGIGWNEMSEREKKWTVDALNLHWWLDQDGMNGDEMAWPRDMKDQYDYIEPIFFTVTAFDQTWLAAMTGQAGVGPRTDEQRRQVSKLRETMPPIIFPMDVVIVNDNGGANEAVHRNR